MFCLRPWRTEAGFEPQVIWLQGICHQAQCDFISCKVRCTCERRHTFPTVTPIGTLTQSHGPPYICNHPHIYKNHHTPLTPHSPHATLTPCSIQQKYQAGARPGERKDADSEAGRQIKDHGRRGCQRPGFASTDALGGYPETK